MQFNWHVLKPINVKCNIFSTFELETLIKYTLKSKKTHRNSNVTLTKRQISNYNQSIVISKKKELKIFKEKNTQEYNDRPRNSKYMLRNYSRSRDKISICQPSKEF